MNHETGDNFKYGGQHNADRYKTVDNYREIKQWLKIGK